ncbi:hydrophobic protein [Streptomyces sp. NBC_01477]|uniref:hydrophobic protein n=1 Tax=Streptomyces sp. NBC_01477 TaxID=2976015 RepID=UPI002E2F0F00|nr:hydrophobic protein [Streptomyces sp. NBC_01477]
MFLWILLLLLGVAAFGLGIEIHALWIAAAVLLAAWLIGFEHHTRHPAARPFTRPRKP